MKRAFFTSFAAAALAASISVGASPAVSAAPASKPSHTQAAGQAEKRLAAEKRKVSALVASKNTALDRAARTAIRAELAVGATQVLDNIGADRDALEGLRTAAQNATTVAGVRAVGAQVRALRPEVYSVVVNGLRQAAHFQAFVAANTGAIVEVSAAADAKALAGFDVIAVYEALTAAQAANEEAAALAEAAVVKGTQLTAVNTKAEREAFSADVAGAGAALDVVEAQLQLATDALAAMVEEPVVEEPVVEEPVVEEPVVEEPAVGEPVVEEPLG